MIQSDDNFAQVMKGHLSWHVWNDDLHSADSPIKLSDLHTAQTPASEVMWAAHFSGHKWKKVPT